MQANYSIYDVIVGRRAICVGTFNLDYAHDQRFERWSARLVWPLLSKSAPIFPGPSSFLRI